MRVRGLGRLRRLAQPYTNFFFPGPIVLAYHRVADPASDPQLLSVTPAHFAEHVEVLRREGYPVPLRHLTEALQDGKTLPRGVVVTFDDGYVDNLIDAKPLLERRAVPATVFVTTAYVATGRKFWWDELEHLLLWNDDLPAALCLSIAGKTHEWCLSGPPNGDGCGASKGRWNILEPCAPDSPQSAYRELHRLLRPLAEEERRAVLAELHQQVGATKAGSAGERSVALSEQQLIALAADGLVEIGSHSVTHPLFSSLPPGAQRVEIERSKSDLEEIIGRTVRSFAYPFGARADYTDETAALIAQAGYDCACSNFTGMVESSTDRFQIPRFLVRDWDGEEFSRRLGAWLGC